MLILALDSTAVVASAALLVDGRPLAAFHVKNGNTHSETLLPMVKSLLDVTGHTVDDVDLFACSKGPGSFTGVRIGAATIKGLAFGKNKPVIGVSTLEALAENVLPSKGLIAAAMNARRNQVYNALFVSDGEIVTRLTPDRALSVADLGKELSERKEPVIPVGDGAELLVKGLADVTFALPPASAVDENALGVGALAYRAYLNGARTTDADLVPTYLRMPQAERERLQRLEEQKGKE